MINGFFPRSFNSLVLLQEGISGDLKTMFFQVWTAVFPVLLLRSPFQMRPGSCCWQLSVRIPQSPRSSTLWVPWVALASLWRPRKLWVLSLLVSARKRVCWRKSRQEGFTCSSSRQLPSEFKTILMLNICNIEVVEWVLCFHLMCLSCSLLFLGGNEITCFGVLFYDLIYELIYSVILRIMVSKGMVSQKKPPLKRIDNRIFPLYPVVTLCHLWLQKTCSFSALFVVWGACTVSWKICASELKESWHLWPKNLISLWNKRTECPLKAGEERETLKLALLTEKSGFLEASVASLGSVLGRDQLVLFSAFESESSCSADAAEVTFCNEC